MVSANNPAVTFVFRARDEATPTMRRLAGGTAQLSQEFRTAIPRLAQFGSSLTSLLITMGALENEKGRVIVRTLAFTSALVSAIPALLSIIRMIGQLNTVLKTTAVLQTFLLALSGVGIGRIAIAAGITGAVGVGLAAETGAFSGLGGNRSSGTSGASGPSLWQKAFSFGLAGGFQTAPGQFRQVPGASGQGHLAVVHGGEVVGRPVGGGLNITIQGGVFTGSEVDAREFARKIGRILQEEGRTRLGGNWLDV